jgi:hypothetical protein
MFHHVSSCFCHVSCPFDSNNHHVEESQIQSSLILESTSIGIINHIIIVHWTDMNARVPRRIHRCQPLQSICPISVVHHAVLDGGNNGKLEASAREELVAVLQLGGSRSATALAVTVA